VDSFNKHCDIAQKQVYIIPTLYTEKSNKIYVKNDRKNHWHNLIMADKWESKSSLSIVDDYQGSESGSSYKFSTENWRVLQNLHEEKKKLKLFEASTLVSSEDEDQSSELLFYKKDWKKSNHPASLTESCTSSNKISKTEDDDVLEKESCLSNGTRSSCSGMNSNKNYEKKYPMFEKLFGNRNVVDSDCDSFVNNRPITPSDYVTEEILSPENLSQNGSFKLERYCRESLLGSSEIEERPSSATEKIVDREKDESDVIPESQACRQVSPVMYSMALCLFGIPKLSAFISMLFKETSGTYKAYPTLSFFIEVFTGLESSTQPSIVDNDTTLNDEPLGLLISSTIEIFHEELLQAKHDGVLQTSCCIGCRYITQKKSHTIISHLFRGQQNKKIFCACGFHHEEDKAITDVTIDINAFKSKSIIIKVVAEVDNQIYVSRMLIDINQYTIVKDITEIIHAKKQRSMRRYKDVVNKTNIFCLSLLSRDDNTHHILDDKVNLFVALQQGDTELCVNETTLGDHQSSEMLSHSISTISTLQSTTIMSESQNHDRRKILASSPAFDVTATSSVGKETTLNLPAIETPSRNNRCQVSALVVVDVLWKQNDEAISFILRLPKVCHGLYLTERIRRILFKITGREAKNFNLTIRNKPGLCIFCLSSICQGCTVQLSDRIVVSLQYQLNVLVTEHINFQKVNQSEDPSITNNHPINTITLKECIRLYSQSHQAVCPSCIDSLSWKPSVTMIKKYPGVLIVQFQRSSTTGYSPVILYPHTDFRPSFGKRNRKFKYDLKCVTTHEKSDCLYMKENERWFVCCGGTRDEIDELPMKDVEMLVYIQQKDVRSTAPCRSSQLKIKKRMNGKMIGKPFKTTTYSMSRSQQQNKNHQQQRRKNLENNRSGYIDFYTTTNDNITMTSIASSSTLNNNTTLNDQESLCACQQCQKFGKIDDQIVKNRSFHQLGVSNDMAPNQNHVNFNDQMSHKKESVTMEMRDETNEIHLHRAIRNQNFKSAVKALNDGADVNGILHGSTALHHAAAMTSPFGEVFIKLLLHHGGDTNAISADGQTPIHTAVIFGREENLTILMRNGGRPTVKDKNGKSPFDFIVNQSNSNSNKENLLRILRMEHCDGESNLKEDEPLGRSTTHDDDDKDNDKDGDEDGDEDFVNVSGNSFKDRETIGERTFDNLFHYNPIDQETIVNNTSLSSLTNQETGRAAMLNESIVSQHFGDQSNLSFEGSVKFSLFSLFACHRGSCSAMRGKTRKTESRRMARVSREKFSDWLSELRYRFT